MMKCIAVTRRRDWLIFCCAALMVGCAASQLKNVRHSYEQSDYATAFRDAEVIVRRSSGRVAEEAAYMAGMSAYHLQEPTRALEFLDIAARSSDRSIAGRAMAQAGLIHHEKGHYETAVRLFQGAAGRLDGDDRARACLLAAAAQQKLGQWSHAAASLRQARRHSSDPGVHRHVKEHMSYGAYTIQLGAFAVEENARRAARAVSGRAAAIRIGHPRMVRAVDVGGRRLILVQVGRFNDHAAASSARSRLSTSADIVPVVLH